MRSFKSLILLSLTVTGLSHAEARSLPAPQKRVFATCQADVTTRKIAPWYRLFKKSSQTRKAVPVSIYYFPGAYAGGYRTFWVAESAGLDGGWGYGQWVSLERKDIRRLDSNGIDVHYDIYGKASFQLDVAAGRGKVEYRSKRYGWKNNRDHERANLKGCVVDAAALSDLVAEVLGNP